MSSWIEQNPEATRLQRIEALARSLPGTASEPSGFALEWYGLEEDFCITDEPIEFCHAFDAIALRCEGCDWWHDPDDLYDRSLCVDCYIPDIDYVEPEEGAEE